jgi:hypothetical protein
MTPVVSRDAFKDALRELLRVEPGLYAESVQLFYREHAPYEPRRVFDYLFIAEDAPQLGQKTKSSVSDRVRRMSGSWQGWHLTLRMAALLVIAAPPAGSIMTCAQPTNFATHP